MKKCEAQVVSVYCEIMEETYKKVAFLKDGKTFVGALFFKLDDWERIVEVHESKTLEAETDLELVNKCVEFHMANDIPYESTPKTMHHWQFMNGFTPTITRWEVGK